MYFAVSKLTYKSIYFSYFHRFYNISENSRLFTPFTCHADAYPPAQYYWILANGDEGNVTRTIGGNNTHQR